MLVDGASSIAKKFGISSLVIGLTVVAFGTSDDIPNFFAILDAPSTSISAPFINNANQMIRNRKFIN